MSHSARSLPTDLFRRIRRDGVADLGQRAVRRLYKKWDAGSLDFPLLPEDVSDSTRLRDYSTLPAAATPELPSGDRSAEPAREKPLTIGWVCTPPGRGSGGHTTLFRMVAEMSERGHRCVLFLYDRHGGDIDRHARVLREGWPQLRVEIRDAQAGIFGVDAAVASSWDTAHVLAARLRTRATLLYFIQDFEPYFYPRGSLHAFAEDSYRFGFHNIALGNMVAGELSARGITQTTVPFGCDTDVYRLTNRGKRSGIVFYTKPGVDRRGFLIAQRGVEEFHRRHPEQQIHVYGEAVDDWSLPIIRHERLDPSELNTLYNASMAGIAMSFTNVSLVAEELLAAGAIPIVNNSVDARADLSNAEVEWATPTPGGIADALCRVVERPDHELHSVAASDAVRHGWGPAQVLVADTIMDAVRAELALPVGRAGS